MFFSSQETAFLDGRRWSQHQRFVLSSVFFSVGLFESITYWMIIIQAISNHFFQWDSPFISSNHGTSMVLPWLDIGCLGVKKFDRWSFLAVWWFDEWCDIIWLVVTGTFGLFSIIYTNGETWNINGILIWLVVWNMAFMTFHNIWECHRPTDELHHFSEG